MLLFVVFYFSIYLFLFVGARLFEENEVFRSATHELCLTTDKALAPATYAPLTQAPQTMFPMLRTINDSSFVSSWQKRLNLQFDVISKLN